MEQLREIFSYSATIPLFAIVFLLGVLLSYILLRIKQHNLENTNYELGTNLIEAIENIEEYESIIEELEMKLSEAIYRLEVEVKGKSKI